MGAVGAFAWPFLRPALNRFAPYMPAGSVLCGNVVHALRKHGMRTGNKRVVDLGSGDGEVVLWCLSRMEGSDIQWTGVEYNRWLNVIARLRCMRAGVSRRASFRTMDLYKYPLESVDAVFVCLVPAMLPRLEERLLKETKKGTLVLSARFPLPTMKPIEIMAGGPISGVWVYKT